MKTKSRLIAIIIIILVIVILAATASLLLFARPNAVLLKPAVAEDSDGSLPSSIIGNMEAGTEDVILKTSPFGHITVIEWEDKIPSDSLIQKAVIQVRWKTDVDRGAGNIFIGYSVDAGKSFVETGPLNESGTEQETTIEVPGPIQGINNIRARWRGEDTDYMLAASGYANFTMEVYL